MGISCPWFTAVQQGAEDASSVDADFSCQGKLPFLPYSFAESQHGCWRFTNPCGDLFVEREVTCDGGTIVCEGVHDIQGCTINHDIWGFGGLSTFWPMTLVFLMLIVRPNSLQTCGNLLHSSWSSSAVLLTNAASTASSSSQIRIVLTLVFALNLAKLNSLPSDLVCRKTPFWESWKACCSSVEKKILISVGARTHPCFTPLVILKGWDVVQSKLIVLWVLPTDKIKGFGEVKESYVQWFALFPAFFPLVVWGRRLGQLLTSLFWNYIVNQGRCKWPVFVAFSASLKHILCQQSLEVIYLNNCCSCCSHLYSCTN